MPPFNEPSRIDQSLMAELRSSWLSGRRTPVEDFVRRHPELARHTETLQDLIYQEYCLRRELGEQPARDEYFRRFPALRPELEKLFAVDSAVATDTVADHSNEARDARPPLDHDDADPAGESSPGMRFKKLRFHAKGGLGEVHVAEDQELHREVALKEIQAKHADDPKNQQRFKLEAEITGGLEHPGIVPVYGLGAYADGRPFYAMRFIRGDSLQDAIRDYHVEYRGDPIKFRQLLRRFSDVCNAMQYAHDRGVLHRDLKPGNIMLGKYGETMVVDWGLAKTTGQVDPLTESDERPLQPASSDQSAPTEHGTLKGTPAYMSPEQASGEINRLGPATDVYSLGATLYHLLTGRAPFTNPDLSATLQMIRQGEVQSPCQVKEGTPKPLAAICMKAMALRPEDRYPSARRLTEEIENWLADEPVDAYVEPLPARVRRWMRKHPGPVAGLSATVLLGLLGAGLLAYLNGKHAHELAEKNTTISGQKEDLEVANQQLAEEKSVAEASTDFLIKSFRRADPEQDGRKLTVYEVLLRANEELNEQTGIDPPRTAAMFQALAESFLGLGLYSEATAAAERALTIRRDSLGEDHEDTLSSMNNLATMYLAAGKLEQALPLFEETLERTKTQFGDDHEHTLMVLSNIARAYQDAGKLDLALPLFVETLRLREIKLGPEHDDTLTSLGNLADAYSSAGKLDLALSLSEKSLRLRRKRYGDGHPATLMAMNNLAAAYQAVGQLDLALPLYEETLERRKDKLGEDHPDTLISMNNLAEGLQTAGRHDLALSLMEDALRLARTKLGEDHPLTLTFMNNLAGAYGWAGKPDSALPMLEETLRLTKAKRGEDHPDTLICMSDLALGYRNAGQLDRAVPLMETTLQLTRAKLGEDHQHTLSAMNNVAMTYLSAKKVELALPLLEETLRRRRNKFSDDHPASLVSLNNLATGYYSAGKFDQALQLSEEALRLTRAKLGNDHPDTLISLNGLAESYRSLGKFDLALPLFAETVELMKAKHGIDLAHTLVAMNNLAMCYRSADQLDVAIPLFEETLGRRKAILGDDHPNTLNSMSNLAMARLDRQQAAEACQLFNQFLSIQRSKAQPNDSAFANTLASVSEALLAANQFAEAEPYLRESLSIQDAVDPDGWITFDTHVMLGRAFLGQKKLAEAETSLLAGYEGLRQREAQIPADGEIRLTNALQNLVELYTALEKPDEAAKWQARLTEHEARQTESPPKEGTAH